MKAWQCDDSRPVPGLVPAEVETPQPQRGEVLIRVHAVGVTGTELLWQPTTHTKWGETRRHALPVARPNRAEARQKAALKGDVRQVRFSPSPPRGPLTGVYGQFRESESFCDFRPDA